MKHATLVQFELTWPSRKLAIPDATRFGPFNKYAYLLVAPVGESLSQPLFIVLVMRAYHLRAPEHDSIDLLISESGFAPCVWKIVGAPESIKLSAEI